MFCKHFLRRFVVQERTINISPWAELQRGAVLQFSIVSGREQSREPCSRGHCSPKGLMAALSPVPWFSQSCVCCTQALRSAAFIVPGLAELQTSGSQCGCSRPEGPGCAFLLLWHELLITGKNYRSSFVLMQLYCCNLWCFMVFIDRYTWGDQRGGEGRSLQ